MSDGICAVCGKKPAYTFSGYHRGDIDATFCIEHFEKVLKMIYDSPSGKLTPVMAGVNLRISPS